MAPRPKRTVPCLEPGCPRMSLPGEPRCEPHHQQAVRNKRGRDAGRPKPYRPKYGKAWQEYSRRARAEHLATIGPICPGFNRGRHQVPPHDLVVDHDLGVMCRGCNSRKAATLDRTRRNA